MGTRLPRRVVIVIPFLYKSLQRSIEDHVQRCTSDNFRNCPHLEALFPPKEASSSYRNSIEIGFRVLIEDMFSYKSAILREAQSYDSYQLFIVLLI